MLDVGRLFLACFCETGQCLSQSPLDFCYDCCDRQLFWALLAWWCTLHLCPNVQTDDVCYLRTNICANLVADIFSLLFILYTATATKESQNHKDLNSWDGLLDYLNLIKIHAVCVN